MNWRGAASDAEARYAGELETAEQAIEYARAYEPGTD